MIYFSSGDKGGVGKSLLANALATYSYTKNNGKVVIIDADTRNSDVFRIHKNYISDKRYILRIELSSKDGWLSLEDSIEEIYNENQNIDIDFVISLPAGMGATFNSELKTFRQSIAKYNQKIVLFWSMDTGIDSINLLKNVFLNCYDCIDHIAVAKNLYFGENENFHLWNDSNLRILLLGLGATEAAMPGLHNRLIPYYKKMKFDETHIKELILKNNIKCPKIIDRSRDNDRYNGEPMPFFKMFDDDVQMKGSTKHRLRMWLDGTDEMDGMMQMFRAADIQANTGEFKEKCAKIVFNTTN